MRLPLHVSIHIYDHLQGASEQYFVQLLRWIPLMYVRCVFVQYAAVCHYRRSVCVSGAPVRVRSRHRFYDQISPGQELQTHIQSYIIQSMTRSHPDRSSRHTYKPTVMTYGRMLQKRTTNVHQRNPT